MGEIVKTKFLCKSGVRKANGRGYSLSSKVKLNWESVFIKGKWYDGEYEVWSKQLFELNGGWKRYWVVDEQGVREEMNRIKMSTIFQLNIEELRDEKINEILK